MKKIVIFFLFFFKLNSIETESNSNAQFKKEFDSIVENIRNISKDDKISNLHEKKKSTDLDMGKLYRSFQKISNEIIDKIHIFKTNNPITNETSKMKIFRENLRGIN